MCPMILLCLTTLKQSDNVILCIYFRLRKWPNLYVKVTPFPNRWSSFFFFFINKTFHLQNFSLKVENVKDGWIHLLLLWSFWLPIIRIDFHRASSIRAFIMDTVWELISLSGNHHTRLRSNRDLICCQVDELMFFLFIHCVAQTHTSRHKKREIEVKDE